MMRSWFTRHISCKKKSNHFGGCSSMARVHVCLILAATIFYPVTGTADGSALNSTSHYGVSNKIIAKEPVPLRNAPPTGFFGFKGAQIDSSLPQQEYEILERRTVPFFFGTQEWVKIRPSQDAINDPSALTTPGSACSDDACWAYFGRHESPTEAWTRW